MSGVSFGFIDETQTTSTHLVCEHCEARLWISDIDDMGKQVDAARWKVSARAGGGYEMFCPSCAEGVLALAIALAVAGR